MLVQRLVYRAQLLTGHEDEGKRILNETALPEDVLTLSVFRFHRNLFFYYECAAALRTPDELFPALNTHLETVPFARYRELSDLFDVDVYEAIRLETCVEKRTSEGGTGKASVLAQLAWLRDFLDDTKK